ncbi:MAG: 3-deoxy-7-phosphoheptulonate synthase [Gammaproteobacteria bacterium]|jgi:3-deoxy-7-phosphoheptulonate synthase
MTNSPNTAVVLENVNIESQQILATPADIKRLLPVSATAARSIAEHRRRIHDVLMGVNHRLLVVVGPCSIHDVDEALEYSKRLANVAREINDHVIVVMRAYFEKPRTTVGWKGFINDPFLDGSFRLDDGIRMARRLLCDISELDLPLATEALDPITPQYLHDLIAWSVIGARTTESQTHREMASGLSAPVGFKNGTDGGLDVALNAIQSAAHPHRFLGINEAGQVAITTTKGNACAHIVLRGGSNGPNYKSEQIAECEQALKARNLPAKIMVDCSHANSNKNYQHQRLVVEDIARQIVAGNSSIVGLMLESNINEGNQSHEPNRSLQRGVSITDACISFEETEQLLRFLYRESGASLLSRHPNAAR